MIVKSSLKRLGSSSTLKVQQKTGAEPPGSAPSMQLSGPLTHSSTHGVTSSVWAMVMKSSMNAGKLVLGHVHGSVHRGRRGEPGPACGARVIHVS